MTLEPRRHSRPLAETTKKRHSRKCVARQRAPRSVRHPCLRVARASCSVAEKFPFA